MGLFVNVYRTSGPDCTCNGMSARFDRLCLVNVDGPFEPDDKAPAALLVQNGPGIVRIVPAIREPGGWVAARAWHMMGGNYAATSDGRFRDAVEAITLEPFYGAVAIHDRVE